MNCRKCAKSLPDGAVYCPWCGARQQIQRSTHKRGNGSGTAYRRGTTWTAAVVVGWKHAPTRHDGRPNPDGLTEAPQAVSERTPIRRTKGGFRTKRDALEYCPILRNGGQALRTAPRLVDLWETYEGGRFEKLSASKQTAYRGAWKKLSALHYRPVDQLTVGELQTTINAVAPSHYTARDCKVVLTRLFELAAAEGWVSKDLPGFIVLPDLEETERQPFTPEEQDALWALYEAGDLRAAIPLLMICTGMMPGEAQALKVEHIDLERRTITGVGLKTKVRRKSPIYLPADAMPIIEDLIEHAMPSGYIWPRNEPKWYAAYYAALEAAGCRRLEPYCCRHTTATRLAVAEGVAPQTVRRVMRWSTTAMLDRYAHPDDDDARAAADTIRKVDSTPLPAGE